MKPESKAPAAAKPAPAADKKAAAAKPAPAADKKAATPAPAADKKAATPAAAAKPAAADKKPADRAAAIAATWGNAEVRAARAVRRPVTVTLPDGKKETYKSVGVAFNTIPVLAAHASKFTRVRLALRKTGKPVKFDVGGRIYTFAE